MKKEKFIGLTYGDPAGIGPEILNDVLRKWRFKFKPLIIGDHKLLKTTKEKIFFKEVQIKRNFIPFGKPSKLSGKHSYECLKAACKLGQEKKIVALVTGPVSKYAVNLAKIKFSGQTDKLSELCSINPKNTIMLFVSEDFRIALYTRHIALKKVSPHLTIKDLKSFLRCLNKELKKWFGLKDPEIAILGLNPHAGESGFLGNEENKIIKPALKDLRQEGLKVFGPLSPDSTLAKAGNDYLKKKKQKYDAYVSMYHDQALPLFKAIAGLNGVNVTLGLPFLRVSVDHGTAFDIAGKNVASSDGLVSAVKFVEALN